MCKFGCICNALVCIAFVYFIFRMIRFVVIVGKGRCAIEKRKKKFANELAIEWQTLLAILTLVSVLPQFNGSLAAWIGQQMICVYSCAFCCIHCIFSVTTSTTQTIGLQYVEGTKMIFRWAIFRHWKMEMNKILDCPTCGSVRLANEQLFFALWLYHFTLLLGYLFVCWLVGEAKQAENQNIIYIATMYHLLIWLLILFSAHSSIERKLIVWNGYVVTVVWLYQVGCYTFTERF